MGNDVISRVELQLERFRNEVLIAVRQTDLRELLLLARGNREAEEDEDDAYKIGLRDGYDKAVQEIDLASGGDGEYRYCTNHDPERHCPDAETMKKRILDRLSPDLES